MCGDHQKALGEIGEALDGVDSTAFETACTLIANAGNVLLYGCGREGVQMRGLAMRLYHLGCRVGMVADMNAPPLGPGDLFVVSAGPGELSTVTALMKVAKRDGAQVLFLTATRMAQAAALADHVVVIPAQTMANDQEEPQSILPMGSVYEGALFMLFEMMILRLRDKMDITPDQMRLRHTNME
ncbi:MAG: SIS domain-containing protein [Sulfitobacter sp.]